uniref:hypothetical protein n=1 Tax=Eshraghiella crossota TaxID=45851 RepID=UPI004027075E
MNLKSNPQNGASFNGVSAYADIIHDGAETIAEAFVRYRRGEYLSEDVMALLQKYVLKKE